ncbi:MAG: large subunit ribosomal protein [Thermoleophilaceae bacterium]|nr:large subunit ribosomal protein [Thermoleophilaceae bacterium]
MAVPKQKQSHSRTNKRRSQHKISPPRLQSCPPCPSPVRPHPGCPTSGPDKGREIVTPDAPTLGE